MVTPKEIAEWLRKMRPNRSFSLFLDKTKRSEEEFLNEYEAFNTLDPEIMVGARIEGNDIHFGLNPIHIRKKFELRHFLDAICMLQLPS